MNAVMNYLIKDELEQRITLTKPNLINFVIYQTRHTRQIEKLSKHSYTLVIDTVT